MKRWKNSARIYGFRRGWNRRARRSKKFCHRFRCRVGINKTEAAVATAPTGRYADGNDNYFGRETGRRPAATTSATLTDEAAARFHSRIRSWYFESNLVALARHRRKRTRSHPARARARSKRCVAQPARQSIGEWDAAILSPIGRRRFRSGRFKKPHERTGGLCRS